MGEPHIRVGVPMTDTIDHNAFIRQQIQVLVRNEYDWDGAGGLPIRDDIVAWYCKSFEGALPLPAGLGLTPPVVRLQPDGTAIVLFKGDGRRVELHTVCAGHTFLDSIDGDTVIQYHLRGSMRENREEILYAIHWVAWSLR